MNAVNNLERDPILRSHAIYVCPETVQELTVSRDYNVLLFYQKFVINNVYINILNVWLHCCFLDLIFT